MTQQSLAPLNEDPHSRPHPVDAPAGLGAGDVENPHRSGHPDTDREVITGELVDPPAGRPSTTQKYRAAREAELRPVVPEWLATPAAIGQTARWALRYYGHKLAYRVVRLVVDVPRFTWWALVGAVTTVRRTARWAWDLDGHPLIGEVTARDDRAYVRMAYDRSRRQKWRFTLLGIGILLGLITVAVLRAKGPAWSVPALTGVVLVALARTGKPADVPVLSGVSVSKRVAPRLTSQAIVTALGGLGIAALSQAVKTRPTSDLFPAPIVRVKTGWLSEIDLPHGVTAAEVAKQRAKLASGLRRPLGAVWPEGDRSASAHEGRVKLYVLDAPLSELPQSAWPLARTGKADIFTALPYGFDTKGDLVRVLLMYSNLLVGAIPRQGKTFSVRVLVLGAALDPTVELHAHELKGTGDLDCVEAIAHRYTSGPAREEDLASVMASIREVHSYLEPRAVTIARLGPDRCPEKKVTRQLANDPGLGLHPVLLVIDEVQELFESEHAAEAEQLLKAIIKRGPALGIVLILSTQKPDAKSLPTAIASNIGQRLCLRVGDQTANDMVLGTSAYRMGMNATLFTDDDKGVGLLRDGGPSARTVRSCYLDGPASARIGRRALALRTAAGRLSGDAAGQHLESDADRLTIVADAVTVWPRLPHADDSAWLHEIETELAEELPDRYGNLDAPWLGDRLRALGIPTADQRKRRVDGKQINRAGVTLSDLRKALEGPTR
ncbi:MAG: segregation ATPase FtsK/SpoIIIE, family [Actinomycetota bacterium]|nr:segregation ATPase FtsK/SpoIIIE, family [Actinomycetota bacterium]